MLKSISLTFLLLLCFDLVISGPGIIRPIPDESGNVHLKIPRGGAVVQPLKPINNSVSISMNMVIDGQACEVNDPLIFYYKVLNIESGSVVLSFPSNFFFIPGCCSGSIDNINIANYARWSLRTRWDGERFIEDALPGCCD